jgi:hypothetical protein
MGSFTDEGSAKTRPLARMLDRDCHRVRRNGGSGEMGLMNYSPPEDNSVKISTGAGSPPKLAAATAGNRSAAELGSTPEVGR